MKTNTKFQTLTAACSLLCILCFNLGFAQQNGSSNSVATGLNEVEWSPAPDFFPGCAFTVLHGEMGEPNMDLFFKIEPNTDVVKHTHNSVERMVLLSGELMVQYEGEEEKMLTPGTYAFGPAEKPHKARCGDQGPCILFIALEKPFNAVPIEE